MLKRFTNLLEAAQSYSLLQLSTQISIDEEKTGVRRASNWGFQLSAPMASWVLLTVWNTVDNVPSTELRLQYTNESSLVISTLGA